MKNYKKYFEDLLEFLEQCKDNEDFYSFSGDQLTECIEKSNGSFYPHDKTKIEPEIDMETLELLIHSIICEYKAFLNYSDHFNLDNHASRMKMLVLKNQLESIGVKNIEEILK